MKDCVIYALRDPRTLEVRYVGQSVNGLSRARNHFSPSAIEKRENPHTSNWIRGVLAAGLRPVAEVIETVARPDDLDEAEVFWIAKCRAMGFALTNMNAGGNKPPLFVVTEAERKARSARMLGKPGHWRGKKFSAEHCAKISAGGKGRPHMAWSRPRPGTPVRDQYGVVYPTIAAAALAAGCDRSCVQRILKRTRRSIKDFSFSYA